MSRYYSVLVITVVVINGLHCRRYLTGKCTVCRRFRASLSPKTLQAGAVKGLICQTFYCLICSDLCSVCMSGAVNSNVLHGSCYASCINFQSCFI